MSVNYKDILNDQFIPSVDIFYADSIGIFKEDNPSIHRVETVQEWFREFET